MGREIIVGLHFYQPPREAFHSSLQDISTDSKNQNWTKIIEKQCYEPLAKIGILNKASFDIYQSLLLQLEKIDPKIASVYQQSMKENGIGESFIHPILPDLSLSDKSIVISAGVHRFKEITGISPKIFWPPETAIDKETLEVLVNNGYQGFICAPEQVIQFDGQRSDNSPTLIKLNRGREIIAYPFDRSISSNLAFDPKKNADIFTQMYINPIKERISSNKLIIAWTDAETFGHHFQYGDKFLSYLLDTSLPNSGLYPVSINDIKFDYSKLFTGKIIERSSWSCPHGNLIRWNGVCGCSSGNDSSWKQPFMETMRFLNNQISLILKQEIGNGYEQLIAENFYHLYGQSIESNNLFDNLIRAKISSLVAQTSCATFFSNPDVSAKINLLYAYQALLYLKESGLSRLVHELETVFINKLNSIYFSSVNSTAFSVLEKMLHQ